MLMTRLLTLLLLAITYPAPMSFAETPQEPVQTSDTSSIQEELATPQKETPVQEETSESNDQSSAPETTQTQASETSSSSAENGSEQATPAESPKTEGETASDATQAPAEEEAVPSSESAQQQEQAEVAITEVPVGSSPDTPSVTTEESVGSEESKVAEEVPSDTPKEKEPVGPRRMRRRKKHMTVEKPTVTMADVPLKHEIPTLTQTEAEKEKEASIERYTKSGALQLGNYLEPWKGADPDERVEMNFQDKELTELLKFLSDALGITFILDDYIEPIRANGLQPLAGTKITFKSTVPLSLKQAWEIGLTFIEMAGFSVIPATQPRTYRVTTNASATGPSANKEPMPTFIGIDPELLPDNDTKIRYVYFAEHAELGTVVQIIESMKSPSAGPLIEVPALRAVILTDKAANIRSTMRILKEIDQVTMPETLAIIRLKHTDAREVRELYHKLIGKDPSSPVFNAFSRQRAPSTTQYFSEATRVFEEPYTNSLIVLGTRENIKRFEDFVMKYVDKSLGAPYSPLHIVQLKYIEASSVAKILNEVIQKFNAHPANTAASLVGGVRDGNKFFRPSVRITPEASGNRLIINADYEEYLKLRETIDQLDREQPQVAIKMLILNVDLTNRNELGVQLRNAKDCPDGTGGLDSILGQNTNFQTAMIGPIVTNPPAGDPNETVNGAKRLLGNLIELANRVGDVSPFGPGTTLATLGKDMFGFWGLLRILETYTRTSIVANPFLVATHKYKSEFKVGETRRTTTSIVTGQRETQAQGDLSADLKIVITPQISYDNMIDLNIYVELGQFVDELTQNRIVRQISTEALLANKEVLAIGGFIRDRTVETLRKVPVLGDVPLLGWLFKNKAKTVERTSLLILICPEIITPGVAETFTNSKIADTKNTLYRMRSRSEARDPIHRWFFNDHKEKEASTIDKFVATQQRYIDESQLSQENVPPATPKKKDAKPPTRRQGLLDLIDQGVPA